MAVFRALQICRRAGQQACPVSSRDAVHENRVARYGFANLSNDTNVQDRQQGAGVSRTRQPC